MSASSNLNDLTSILYNGTFFYPAWRHYGRQINVVCNKCGIQQLTKCIGYHDMDLCLQCAITLVPVSQQNLNIVIQNKRNSFDIICNGNIFCPSWKHYGKIINVVCDNCLNQNLQSSIGYLDMDLCLYCADEVV